VPKLTATPEALAIDGVPALVQAGVITAYRLPHPDLWRGALERLRVGGFNTVMLPLPWAYYSPAPGFHDFTGPRDVSRLLDETARAGLWVIPHLGPWVDADLDRGGVPAWAHRLPRMQAVCDPDPAAGLPSAFLWHLSDWWDRALPLIRDRPNLIALALDPGRCAEGRRPRALTESLVGLLRAKGIGAALVVPEDLRQDVGDGCLAMTSPGRTEPGAGLDTGPPTLALVDLTRLGAGTVGAARTRAAYLQPFALGGSAAVLTPAHTGIRWGWWSADRATTGEECAPIGESGTLPEAYYDMRRLVVSLETMGGILVDAGPGYDVRAEPEDCLMGARSGRMGSIACLRGGPNNTEPIRLTAGGGDRTLSVGDVALDVGEVAALPIDWRLADSRLPATNLEPVLHTVVAGRELVVLRNAAGGELLLPAELRPRHQRGAVRVERLSGGLQVRFDRGRVASLVLDGGRGPLQLLALAPPLAARVWPLDDQWRTTPTYPAAWHPAPTAPARGLIIGPDLVLPREDGGYRFLVRDRGFGYRWGPWRGSDPHTWLSPLNWSAPAPLSVPPLTWASRPGAPEVLRDYDDLSWRTLLPGGPLSMDAHEIDAGFAWYRAHIEGMPSSVTLPCRGACDLFLNGMHIASLNPPPGDEPVTPKSLPLPARYLQAGNVLAILVEAQGRAAGWEPAAGPRGLLACDPDGGQIVRWCIRSGLTGERQDQGFPGFADWRLVDGEGASAITWHRSRFDLGHPPDVEGLLFLVLDRMPTKSYIYLNGMLIGRMWYPNLPQRRFRLPDGVLRRTGDNELLIAQWTRGGEPGIGMARLEVGATSQWHEQGP
jgi:hypothetical protein